jgi:hypothetical protein
MVHVAIRFGQYAVSIEIAPLPRRNRRIAASSMLGPKL